MTDATNPNGDACANVSLMVIWSPTGELSPEERTQVEEHVKSCTSCADLLLFAAETKRSLGALGRAHPLPEDLVLYAEDDRSFEADVRAALEGHLDGCRECSEEVAILREVDRALEPSMAPAAGSIPRRLKAGTAPSSWWRRSVGAALRPAPAAVYLGLAIAASLLLLLPLGPGRHPAVETQSDSISRTPAIEANGVVLLLDVTGKERDLTPRTVPTPSVDGADPVILLLELTELSSPPIADALYQVEILPDGKPAPIWSTEVPGSAFAANYTLALSIPAGRLTAGRYVIRIGADDKSPIFKSDLIVK